MGSALACDLDRRTPSNAILSDHGARAGRCGSLRAARVVRKCRRHKCDERDKHDNETVDGHWSLL